MICAEDSYMYTIHTLYQLLRKPRYSNTCYTCKCNTCKCKSDLNVPICDINSTLHSGDVLNDQQLIILKSEEML